jgi:hypothetical protein
MPSLFSHNDNTGGGGAQEMCVKEYKHGPTARARRTLAGEERTCSLYITRRACIGQQIARMRTAGEVGGHRWDKRRTRDLMLRREKSGQIDGQASAY